MSSKFVHLHLHTDYSLLDGMLRIPKLVPALKEKGFQSCAITDHGNLHGVIAFHHALKKEGIKPIIGMEAYIAKGSLTTRQYASQGPNAYHCVLLCQNKEGYHNLCKLASIGFTQGKYYGKPRIDREVLEKHNKGLIVLSACLQGEITKRLLEGEVNAAKETAQWYSQVFENRYYIELQNHGLAKQIKTNPLLINIANELNVPLVGTNDCHYLTRDEAQAHKILQFMGWQRKITDDSFSEMETQELYLKTADEMAQAFADLPATCLTNTAKIADECEIDLVNKQYFLPDYPTQNDVSLDDELRQMATSKLKHRIENISLLYGWKEEERQEQEKIYTDRLLFELNVIIDMGFAGYFLIVADFINWAKENKISVGPGRGSGAGSLVAYALRITDIDPIHYDLLFERFLNPDRISMPDFDIDFEVEGRERVIDYVKEKYGKTNVCQISAIGSLQAKGALRGVARVLDIPYAQADDIAKMIPNVLNISLTDAIEQSPDLKAIASEGTDIQKRLITLALQLEGLNINLSTHAAGVIIMNTDITDIMPICTPTKGDTIQSMYTMKYAEDQGAVKFDFLGLRNLSIIDKTIDIINEQEAFKDNPLSTQTIPLNDKATFSLLAKGDTTGIFQLESQGMKRLIQKFKPDCFEDIIAIVALYRPGPLGSGMVDNFVKRKHKEQKINYDHPLMEEVLKETYGVMVYQEQVMRLVQVLAGFSLGEADLLRRAIGKKIIEIIEQQEEQFIQGCAKNDISEAIAKGIFSLIQEFAKYGFNKSHSAAYALISYQTAWLKANHPVAFMAALLTVDRNRPESIIKLINECHSLQIPILPPDCNHSNLYFTTFDTQIRFGLSAIKNVSDLAIQAILEERQKNGAFTSLVNFFSRVNSSKLNIRVVTALVYSGVFDSFEPNRNKIIHNLPLLLSFTGDEANLEKQGFMSIFNMIPETENKEQPVELEEVLAWSDKTQFQNEKDALGFYISGHPLTAYTKELKALVPITSITECKERISSKTRWITGIIMNSNTRLTKQNKYMSILQIEDTTGFIEVVVYPHLYQQTSSYLAQGNIILLQGKMNAQENQSFIPNQIHTITSLRNQFANNLLFRIPQSTTKEDLTTIKNLIAMHPGSQNVYTEVETHTPFSVLLRLNTQVLVTDTFIESLQTKLPNIGLSFSYNKQQFAEATTYQGKQREKRN